MNNQNRLTSFTPIFIVGAPRSGTTLMGQIIGRHTQVFSANETHFFEDVWARRRELGELKTASEIFEAVSRVMILYQRYNFPEAQAMAEDCLNPQQLVQDVLALGGGYGALYISFMTTLAHCAGKPIGCDDTPKHLYHVPNIIKMFPNARFIGLIRDPRDYLYSYMNYWRRSTESDRIKALYHPIITAVLWRNATKLLIEYQQRYAGNFLLIRYEELVDNPLSILPAMCTFLDLEQQTAMLDVDTSNSSFEFKQTGIYATSVGRWYDGLPPEDAWWCQVINGRYLSSFQYEQVRINVTPSRLIKTIITLPFAFIRGLKANRHKRGPLTLYLARRIWAAVK